MTDKTTLTLERTQVDGTASPDRVKPTPDDPTTPTTDPQPAPIEPERVKPTPDEVPATPAS